MHLFSFDSMHSGFQDRRIRPLCHASGRAKRNPAVVRCPVPEVAGGNPRRACTSARAGIRLPAVASDVAARGGRRRAAALVGVGVLLASACAQTGVRQGVVSGEALVLDVPLIEQDELHECGLAAVTALCRYHGVEIPAGDRARLVEIARERAGLSGSELQQALERAGLEVFLFQGTLDRSATGLYAHLERGRPCLAMISRDGESRHYVLVVGYDPAPGSLVLFDPRRGLVLIREPDFERMWARASHFTLLAVPRATGPAEPTRS